MVLNIKLFLYWFLKDFKCYYFLFCLIYFNLTKKKRKINEIILSHVKVIIFVELYSILILIN
jgi:hypothetical protein